MVKMIRDNTGRFAERPFYRERDLDNECERLIRDLLLKRHGQVDYPVATDDLTVLIEMHDADLEPAETLVDSVRDMKDGGVDVVFEVTGRQSAVALAQEIINPGGEIVCIGVADANAMYSYPHTRAVAEEMVIRGSHMGSGNAHWDIPGYLDYFRQGRMPVDRLKSHSIGLGDLNMALDRLA